jgi:lipopolysaccharide transport system ATP-binding protein
VWLKNGHLHQDGKSGEIIEAYFNSVSSERTFSCENPDYGLAINKVVLKNDRGDDSSQFSPGEDLVVEISYNARKRIEKPIIALGVLGVNGSCFTANMLLDGYIPKCLEGAGQIKCTFRSIPLLPQSYTVKMIVRSANVKDLIVPYQEVAYFNVVGDLGDYGYKGEFLTFASQATPVVVPYEWQLPDGTTREVALRRLVHDGADCGSPADRSFR